MRITADYHTHTVFSHGKGAIIDNVEEALRKGLCELAISDHGPSHMTYGVKRTDYPRMREEIDKLQQRYRDIRLLLGVEANLIGMNGEIDVTDEDRKLVDIVLLGFHNGAKPVTSEAAVSLYLKNYLSKPLSFLRESCRQSNTDALIHAIQKNKVQILSHPGAKIDIDVARLSAAAIKCGTALEINASHGNLTVEYAKIALENGADFMIGSDAHIPENVGNFAKGIRIAEEAGIPVSRILNAVED